jgi:hypothetical protein
LARLSLTEFGRFHQRAEKGAAEKRANIPFAGTSNVQADGCAFGVLFASQAGRGGVRRTGGGGGFAFRFRQTRSTASASPFLVFEASVDR